MYVCILPKDFLVIFNTSVSQKLYIINHIWEHCGLCYLKDSWSKTFCTKNSFCLPRLQLSLPQAYSVFSSVLSLCRRVQSSRSLHEMQNNAEKRIWCSGQCQGQHFPSVLIQQAKAWNQSTALSIIVNLSLSSS